MATSGTLLPVLKALPGSAPTGIVGALAERLGREGVEIVSLWAGLAVLAIMIPIMLWFSTGWVQFGYRYSLDFLPFLLILIASGMGDRIGKGTVAIVAVSLAVNLWGALYSANNGW